MSTVSEAGSHGQSEAASGVCHMKASHIFTVNAKTAAEAKTKAFKKFKSERNKRSAYNVWVDKV